MAQKKRSNSWACARLLTIRRKLDWPNYINCKEFLQQQRGLLTEDGVLSAGKIPGGGRKTGQPVRDRPTQEGGQGLAPAALAAA